MDAHEIAPAGAAGQVLSWSDVQKHGAGKDPDGGVEASFSISSPQRVLTGVGGRIHDDNLVTLWVETAELVLHADGTVGLTSRSVTSVGKDHQDDPNKLEAAYSVYDRTAVIVGVGMRAHDDNLETLVVYFRALGRDGALGPLQSHGAGKQPDKGVEAAYVPPEADTQTILVGLGARVHDDNVVTLRADTARLSLHDAGRFVPPMSQRRGPDPDAGLEASFQSTAYNRLITGIGGRIHDDNVTTLTVETAEVQKAADGTYSLANASTVSVGPDPKAAPEAYISVFDRHAVVTGFGMRAHDDNLATLLVYARTLQPDGTLGPLITLTAGRDPDQRPEVVFNPDDDTSVLLGLGARARHDNIRTIEATVVPMESVRLALDGKAPSLTEEEVHALITAYGPMLYLHPDDTYLMSSVDWFLDRATLKNADGLSRPASEGLPAGHMDGGIVVPCTPDQKRQHLPQCANTYYWLDLPEADRPGAPETATAYVHAYAPSVNRFTDLQFWFFYPFNGPGTGHLIVEFEGISHKGDASMAPLGIHGGDWEHAVLRFDTATKSLHSVAVAQHGDVQWITDLGTLERQGQQVVLYSSRNGHATYVNAGSHYTEKHDYSKNAPLPTGLVFELRNDTKRSSDAGHILNAAQRYHLVAADFLPNPPVPPAWLAYPYRWGPTLHLKVDEKFAEGFIDALVGKILGSGAKPFLRLPYVKDWVADLANRIVTKVYSTTVSGPTGPMAKDRWIGKESQPE